MAAVTISVLADASNATSGLDDVGRSAHDMSDKVRDADRATSDLGEKFGDNASKSSQLAGGIGDLGGALSQIPGPVGAIGTGMEALGPTVMGAVGAFDLMELVTKSTVIQQAKQVIVSGAQKVAMLATAVATNAVAAAQWLWNAAMSANPIGLIIIGIVALVVAIVILWKKSETFRRIVTAAWTAIKVAAVAVFNYLKIYLMAVWASIKVIFTVGVNALKAIWGGIKWLWTKAVEIFNAVKAAIATALGWVRAKIASAVQGVLSVWGRITELAGKTREVFGQVLSYIGGLPGRFLDIGKRIIQGLIDGVKSAIGGLTGLFKGITDKIPKWKGPPRKDANLLRDNGKLIMQGLIGGVESERGALQSTLSNVTADISTGVGVPRMMVQGGAPAVGVAPIYMTVNTGVIVDRRGLVDTVATAVNEVAGQLGRPVKMSIQGAA